MRTPHARRLPGSMLVAAVVATLLAPAATAIEMSSDGLFSDREKPRTGGVLGVDGTPLARLARGEDHVVDVVARQGAPHPVVDAVTVRCVLEAVDRPPRKH